MPVGTVFDANIDPKYANKYQYITFDEEQSVRFLTKLCAPHDFATYKFVFATFTDNKLANKDMKQALIRQFIGTYEQSKKALQECNMAGCGIFVTVNRHDGLGRKEHNITRINAAYIEADEGLPQTLPIKPSMVVESSPGKNHYYFLTDTADKITARAVQLKMVQDYGCDKNAKDLSRVLRIPGFSHLKAQQHIVALVEDNGHRYIWSEIIKAFPPIPVAPRYTQKAINENALKLPNPIVTMAALSFINPEFPNDRDGWLQTIMAIHYEFRGSDEGLQIADEWSKGEYQTPPIQPPSYNGLDDVTYIWNSLSYEQPSGAHITMGSLIHRAKAQGYVPANEPPPFVISHVPECVDNVLKKISKHYAIADLPGGGTKILRRNPSTGRYTFGNKNDLDLALGAVKIPEWDEKKGKIKWSQALNPWIYSDYPVRFKNASFHPRAKMYCDENKSLMPGKEESKSLNLYYGTDIRPLQGDTTLIEDLILNVVCNGHQKSADHFHDWVAFTRQFPEKKTGLMITLMGEKGSGKSMTAELIKGLHDPFTYTTSDFSRLTDAFNAHYAQSTLILLEEAVWGGKESDNAILKDLVTNAHIPLRTKFLSDDNSSMSCFDIIATANPGFSAPEDIRSRERRFWTLSVSDIHRKDKKYFGQFGRYDSAKRHDLLRAYAYFLDQRNLDHFDPQDIPTHVGAHSRFNQIEASGDGLKFLLDMIENSEVISIDDTDPMTMSLEATSINKMWNHPDPKEPLLVPIKLVKNAYVLYAKTSRSPTLSAIHIFDEMQPFLPTPILKRAQPTVGHTDKYAHLTKGGKYVSMPNKTACVDHLKSMQLMD